MVEIRRLFAAFLSDNAARPVERAAEMRGRFRRRISVEFNLTCSVEVYFGVFQIET